MGGCRWRDAATVPIYTTHTRTPATSYTFTLYTTVHNCNTVLYPHDPVVHTCNTVTHPHDLITDPDTKQEKHDTYLSRFRQMSVDIANNSATNNNNNNITVFPYLGWRWGSCIPNPAKLWWPKSAIRPPHSPQNRPQSPHNSLVGGVDLNTLSSNTNAARFNQSQARAVIRGVETEEDRYMDNKLTSAQVRFRRVHYRSVHGDNTSVLQVSSSSFILMVESTVRDYGYVVASNMLKINTLTWKHILNMGYIIS